MLDVPMETKVGVYDHPDQYAASPHDWHATRRARVGLKGLLAAVSTQAKEFRQYRGNEPASPAQALMGKVVTAIKAHPIPAIAIGIGVIAVRALRRAR